MERRNEDRQITIESIRLEWLLGKVHLLEVTKTEKERKKNTHTQTKKKKRSDTTTSKKSNVNSGKTRSDKILIDRCKTHTHTLLTPDHRGCDSRTTVVRIRQEIFSLKISDL